MRRLQNYPIFRPFLRNTLLLVILLMTFATKANSQGVEFFERELELNGEAFESFSSQLVETQYDQKNEINELRFSHATPDQVIYSATESKEPKVSRPIFMVIGQRLGLTIYKKLDPDLDGFFEEIFRKVEGEKYLFEELFTFGEGNFYRMRRRYYPNPGSTLLKVEVAFRDKVDGAFKVTGGYTFSSIEAMTQERTAPHCMNPIPLSLERNFARPINNIIRSFDIPWPSSGGKVVNYDVKFDSSCEDEMSRYLKDDKAKPEHFYAEAINEGLKCLQGLSNMNNPKNNSFSRILYLNATAGLTGQAVFISPMGKTADDSVNHSNPSFPQRAPRRGFKTQQMLCSQKPSDFKDNQGRPNPKAIGMASVLPTEKTKIKCKNGNDLRIEYPYISINFQKLNESSDRARLSKEERKREIKKVIFHEFLHTTGVPHEDGYDPVNACAKLCFDNGISGEAKAAALRVCTGHGMGTFDQQSIQTRAEAQYEYNSYFKN